MEVMVTPITPSTAPHHTHTPAGVQTRNGPLGSLRDLPKLVQVVSEAQTLGLSVWTTVDLQ